MVSVRPNDLRTIACSSKCRTVLRPKSGLSCDCYMRHIHAAADEIERLQHDVNRLIATNTELATENERLQVRVAELEGYLDQLLNQCAGDHMTACEKTMGDSHPCTCGAAEIRKALQETE